MGLQQCDTGTLGRPNGAAQYAEPRLGEIPMWGRPDEYAGESRCGLDSKFDVRVSARGSREIRQTMGTSGTLTLETHYKDAAGNLVGWSRFVQHRTGGWVKSDCRLVEGRPGRAVTVEHDGHGTYTTTVNDGSRRVADQEQAPEVVRELEAACHNTPPDFLRDLERLRIFAGHAKGSRGMPFGDLRQERLRLDRAIAGLRWRPRTELNHDIDKALYLNLEQSPDMVRATVALNAALMGLVDPKDCNNMAWSEMLDASAAAMRASGVPFDPDGPYIRALVSLADRKRTQYLSQARANPPAMQNVMKMLQIICIGNRWLHPGRDSRVPQGTRCEP